MSSRGPGAGGQGTRVDVLEVEAFKKMTESAPFLRIWVRIGAENSRAFMRCAREDNELDLRRAQGAQAALAMVLTMPEQILAEMRAGKKARGE